MIQTDWLPCIREDKFKTIYAGLSIPDMAMLGFEFGDSVDIAFDNGVFYHDVPYYNGHYGRCGQLVLCGYQGFPHPSLGRSQGESTYEEARIQSDTKIRITLFQKEKYKELQESLNIAYSYRREDYDSDESFANFYAVAGGKMKENFLYRGVSPIDDRYHRANYADLLLKKYDIRYILNITDNENDIEKHKKDGDYQGKNYASYYENGKVHLMNIAENYRSPLFAKNVVAAFVKASKQEGPIYLHCTEGKDRTGILSILIQGLLGASYQEMVANYMKTYANYYGLKETDDKYKKIVDIKVSDLLRNLSDDPNIDLSSTDYVPIMKNYFRFGKANEEDIKKIIDFFGKDQG